MNVDQDDTPLDHRGLVVDQEEGLRDFKWEIEEFGINIEEGRKLYFYPEGPEFRIEYIHERVED